MLRRSLIAVVPFLTCALVAQSPGASLSPSTASAPAPAAAADPNAVDEAANAFFLEEGMQRSQVAEHLSWLCDVYGPRVTGSPNIRRAQAWAVKRFSEFGLTARTERWGPFGRGWRCDRVVMEVVGDNPWPVIGYAKVWSPNVSGAADVVNVATMSKEALEAADLAGKIVLLEEPRAVSEPFDGISRRFDEKDRLRMADQLATEAQPAGQRAADARNANDFRVGFQRRAEMLTIVQKKRPLAIVDRGSKGDYGTVFVQDAWTPPRPDAAAGERPNPRTADAQVIPQFTIAVEHYNRMCRLLAKGLPVRMALELKVTFQDDDANDYNVVADLKGGDAAIGDQFAMLGAHLDSWQSGTGATDNGCGSAVVIEAARLIAEYCKKTGVAPRRSVRACLWSGEEQGLLGSKAFVTEHYGSYDKPTAEQAKVSGYFNLDNGTGAVRGVYLQGNEACAPIFRAWLRPFHVHGASTLTLDDTGGTDHLSFHGVGVPGFQFIQDPVSYGTKTHHSNMDVWDHAIADDLKQASVIMASFVWHTAQRAEMLPRHKVVPRPARGEGRRGAAGVAPGGTPGGGR